MNYTKHFRKRALALLLVLSVLLSMTGCSAFLRFDAGRPATEESGADDAYVEKVQEIVEYINKYYVDDYTTENLDDYLAAAVIASMGDRWSYYISAEEYDSYMEQSNNAYVGIGVTIEETEDGEKLTVVSVTHDSPAEEGGVREGDLITAVEGESIVSIGGMSGAQKKVKGEEGTDVTLTIERDGKRFDVTLTRRTIETEIVAYELLDSGEGYIKINNFDTHAARDTIAAIDDLMAQDAKALIFDLRFNPGGYKHELVEILDYLLPEGPLFRSVDYKGNEEVDYSEASYIDIPMAVLVNDDSYSAAEFFAAALQEYEAGVVVGTQTCGKANYQQTFRLSDGSAIAISTGHYQTPKGVTLDGIGVTPDVVVTVDEETYLALYHEEVERQDDAQLQAALQALRGEN